MWKHSSAPTRIVIIAVHIPNTGLTKRLPLGYVETVVRRRVRGGQQTRQGGGGVMYFLYHTSTCSRSLALVDAMSVNRPFVHG